MKKCRVIMAILLIGCFLLAGCSGETVTDVVNSGRPEMTPVDDVSSQDDFQAHEEAEVSAPTVIVTESRVVADKYWDGQTFDLIQYMLDLGFIWRQEEDPEKSGKDVFVSMRHPMPDSTPAQVEIFYEEVQVFAPNYKYSAIMPGEWYNDSDHDDSDNFVQVSGVIWPMYRPWLEICIQVVQNVVDGQEDPMGFLDDLGIRRVEGLQ